MMETIAILFFASFFVTSISIVILLIDIGRHLHEIRDDLREYFKAETRRRASDYEWRN